MADKNDKNLIGFDPLAWMNEEDVEKTDIVEASKADENREENADETVIEAEPESIAEPKNKESVESKITLDATLNIQNVNHLYEQLLALLESQDTIEIDASAVVSVDAASLQLLIVLKQAAMKLHKDVVIDFPSDNFIEAAALLGMSEMLDVNQAAAGLF